MSASGYCLVFVCCFADFTLVLLIKVLLIKKFVFTVVLHSRTSQKQWVKKNENIN